MCAYGKKYEYMLNQSKHMYVTILQYDTADVMGQNLSGPFKEIVSQDIGCLQLCFFKTEYKFHRSCNLKNINTVQ